MKPAKREDTTDLKVTIEKWIIIFFGVVLRILKVVHFDALRFYLRRAMFGAKIGSMGDNVCIYPHVVIHNPKQVSIGNRVQIAEFVHIWGGGGVLIGSNTLIASHCVITSQTHNFNLKLYRETSECKPVVIGQNVWIGAGAIILPGVTIGNNSVIGAGSVVNKDVSENIVVAGVPAKFLRNLH